MKIFSGFMFFLTLVLAFQICNSSSSTEAARNMVIMETTAVGGAIPQTAMKEFLSATRGIKP